MKQRPAVNIDSGVGNQITHVQVCMHEPDEIEVQVRVIVNVVNVRVRVRFQLYYLARVCAYSLSMQIDNANIYLLRLSPELLRSEELPWMKLHLSPNLQLFLPPAFQ